jgi:heptosyltransferase-1
MKILIVKISAIGDIIQSFHVLEYLKKKFLNLEVDWVVSKEALSLIESHPLIGKAICFEGFFKNFKVFYGNLRRKSYDVVFDLQGNCKSGIVTFLARSSDKVGFNYKSVFEWPNLLATNIRYFIDSNQNMRFQYLELVKSYFKDKTLFSFNKRLLLVDELEEAKIEKILKNLNVGGGIKVLVSPNSKWSSKEIPKFILLDFLSYIERNLKASFLFIWGNEKEREKAFSLHENFKENSVVLKEKLKFSTLQNLIDRMDLVIASDSSVLHLCDSVKTPSFSFFGPTSKLIFKPLGDEHFSLQGRCPYGKVFQKKCSDLRFCKSGKCMEKYFKVEEIFKNWWHEIK